jgi:hypothetical protein
VGPAGLGVGDLNPIETRLFCIGVNRTFHLLSSGSPAIVCHQFPALSVLGCAGSVPDDLSWTTRLILSLEDVAVASGMPERQGRDQETGTVRARSGPLAEPVNGTRMARSILKLRGPADERGTPGYRTRTGSCLHGYRFNGNTTECDAPFPWPLPDADPKPTDLGNPRKPEGPAALDGSAVLRLPSSGI